MISSHMKPAVVKIITPFCRGLLRIGITPNMMTIFGTSIVVLGSWLLLAQGRLVAAFFIIGMALLTDLLDGTMARISESGASIWGNFLDSTLDRISDAAVLLGLSYYLYKESNQLFVVSMITVAVSALVPYARAKAESLNIECKGGFAERSERLLLLGFFGVLHMLGITWALNIGVWLLLILSTFTVYQRMAIVWKATRGA
ncbi:MAG: phosphatidylinositol phosphate synthase [Candidatus Nanopelagicaceae bacterium]